MGCLTEAWLHFAPPMTSVLRVSFCVADHFCVLFTEASIRVCFELIAFLFAIEKCWFLLRHMACRHFLLSTVSLPYFVRTFLMYKNFNF